MTKYMSDLGAYEFGELLENPQYLEDRPVAAHCAHVPKALPEPIAFAAARSISATSGSHLACSH